MTQEEILKKYPDLYVEKDLSMQETCMCWGLEVPEAWFPVIDVLSDTLSNTYIRHGDNCRYRPKFIAKQVKAKFNELRFYFDTKIEVLNGEISEEEEQMARKEAQSYANGAIALAELLIHDIEKK